MEITYPSITLHLGKLPAVDRVDLASAFATLQQDTFDLTGVILPFIQIREAEELKEVECQVQIDERLFGPVALDGPTLNAVHTFVISILRQELPSLLTESLLDHYLTKLEAYFPLLVEAARKRSSLEGLTQMLRAKLEAHVSVKNLPSVLEEYLMV